MIHLRTEKGVWLVLLPFLLTTKNKYDESKTCIAGSFNKQLIKMKVKFIQEYLGIKEGTIVDANDRDAKRWIEKGVAEEVKRKAPAKKKELKEDKETKELKTPKNTK